MNAWLFSNKENRGGFYSIMLEDPVEGRLQGREERTAVFCLLFKNVDSKEFNKLYLKENKT